MSQSPAPSLTTPETYYALLGINPWASEIEIRRAYRELSKLYHPDTTSLAPAVATAKFQAINAAYATLSNPERRSVYDRSIQFSRFSYFAHNGSATPSNLQTDQSDGLPTERPLSGGELFALFLMGITLVLCVALVFLVGWLRGDHLLPANFVPPTYGVSSVSSLSISPVTDLLSLSSLSSSPQLPPSL
ncbi:MAG: J domain-containing protein [Pseudanabaenaceae cyanobacterium]|jgi:curved DNA-binding protein CbpA